MFSCTEMDMAEVAGLSNNSTLESMGDRASRFRWSKLTSEIAQGTVEAAFALPVLMILLLLLLQPGIVLYDRIVMQSAAAEGCRLMTTASSADASNCDDFIRRRLSAIPQIDQFHVHSSGCSWQIDLSGDEASGNVSVKITNKLKPLPLLDAGSALLGIVDAQGCLKIEVESTQKTQPDWLLSSTEGAGTPASWVGIDD